MLLTHRRFYGTGRSQCNNVKRPLKEGSAGYFWSCIFVFFIAHWNMWNNINHWHKNTQLELFWTLLSCNYNTTISIKTNRSITWTLNLGSLNLEPVVELVETDTSIIVSETKRWILEDYYHHVNSLPIWYDVSISNANVRER